MSTTPDFEQMYRRDQDPWSVASSWYERRKLGLLVASLPREQYLRGWEPGCGIGVPTRALSQRVRHLVASDVSETAVRLTRERTAGLDGVEVLQSGLPDVPLPSPVDLVVAAEFLYYLPDTGASFAALWSACAPEAHLVLVHWRHHPHDAHRSGETQHREVVDLATARGAAHLVTHRDRDFVLDVLEVPR